MNLHRMSIDEQRIQNRVQMLRLSTQKMQKEIEEAARRAQLILEAKKRNEETLLERMRI